MRSRRNALTVLGALPLLLLIWSPAAIAAPPTVLVGSFTQVSFTTSNERAVGASFMFDFTETDTLTGGLTGTSEIEGSCNFRPTGFTVCRGVETFTGTVDGRSGTAQFWNVLEVNVFTGDFTGRFTALSGTGDLVTLHGQGTFAGSGTTGTHALQAMFAP
jgi:hypothetical protein